jgi:hypothetical protein
MIFTLCKVGAGVPDNVGPLLSLSSSPNTSKHALKEPGAVRHRRWRDNLLRGTQGWKRLLKPRGPGVPLVCPMRASDPWAKMKKRIPGDLSVTQSHTAGGAECVTRVGMTCLAKSSSRRPGDSRKGRCCLSPAYLCDLGQSRCVTLYHGQLLPWEYSVLSCPNGPVLLFSKVTLTSLN